MCGIVGYVGPRNAVDVLIAGLSHLEYRGYDSVGIATLSNNLIETVKVAGRVDNIRPLVESLSRKRPQCGIGHTRWATHGAPTTINAHPHSSDAVTIVHNGIIENYQELKNELIREGIRFISDTDTEVIVRLLDKIYREIPQPLEAIRNLVSRLEGSYALGILFKDIPETLYGIRKGSPLLVGIGDHDNFMASDMTPLLEYTKQYYLLEEDEICEITSDDVLFFNNTSLASVTKQAHTVTWDAQSAQKNGFDHYMLKEIFEQPEVLYQTVAPRIHDHKVSFKHDGIEASFFENVERIHIVACGTAMYAGLVGKQWLEQKSKIVTLSHVASEFRYQTPLLKANDLVIVITQSGETADTLACLRLANEANVRTLAIVNVYGSSIAREAQQTIMTYAGLEIAVASTKAYTTQLGVLYLLACYLSKTSAQEILNVIDMMNGILERKDEIDTIASNYTEVKDAFYIGRGLDSASSEEGSLKLKEVSYVHSEAYPAGELKHGTISLIDSSTLTVAIATQSHIYEKTLSNVQEVKARAGKIFLICQDGMNQDPSIYDDCFVLPKITDELAPFLSVIPLQLFAYAMSLNRGRDIDKPRNLAKSVTVE